MFVRQLDYLVAVAREGHFGRAAQACNVSQPTLSAGLRKLEEELGVPLVVRGHRFLGLTEHGKRVLARARRIVADYEGLRQDISGPGAALVGTLRLGAIPTALPALPPLLNAFCARHPLVRVSLRAMSSAAILKGLEDMAIDAGVTYLDDRAPLPVQGLALYEESYVLVTALPALSERESLRWADAASLPLCLLTPDMQNRQIIDRLFAAAGVRANPRIEANSIAGLWSLIRSGMWSGIVPAAESQSFGTADGLRVIPLVEPEHGQTVGLLTGEQDPAPPVATALLRLARTLPVGGSPPG